MKAFNSNFKFTFLKFCPNDKSQMIILQECGELEVGNVWGLRLTLYQYIEKKNWYDALSARNSVKLNWLYDKEKVIKLYIF